MCCVTGASWGIREIRDVVTIIYKMDQRKWTKIDKVMDTNCKCIRAFSKWEKSTFSEFYVNTHFFFVIWAPTAYFIRLKHWLSTSQYVPLISFYFLFNGWQSKRSALGNSEISTRWNTIRRNSSSMFSLWVCVLFHLLLLLHLLSPSSVFMLEIKMEALIT